jgi:2-oxoacid:acceptor oxidoreductase gamma subunit (pyruvate/2-ketoisovalerate family)
MLEIKFKGRGGQGVVLTSEILGRTFFSEGKYAQCFSLFGGERRGAPVVGFLRVDEEPILLKCQIQHPDHLLLFDLSLMDEMEIKRELKAHGTLLINTDQGIESFKTLRPFKMGLIDAGPIARRAGLGETLNTAMLGAYVSLTRLISKERVIETLKEMFAHKAKPNIEAFQEAYDQVRIYGERDRTL